MRSTYYKADPDGFLLSTLFLTPEEAEIQTGLLTEPPPQRPIAEPEQPSFDDLKAAKNAAINAAREEAELSGFSHSGKWFQSATLDQRNIDKVAWHIARHNAFPADFPGAWKAADNTWLPMPSVSDFDAFMNSLIARGVQLFAHAQALKAQLAAATTPEEVEAVPVW